MTFRSSATARAYRPGTVREVTSAKIRNCHPAWVGCRLDAMRGWPLVVVLAACGAGGHGGPGTDGSGGGSADGGIDAPVPPGWTDLIGRTWSLDVNEQSYW